jgi:putative ABC transport system ATP-binding protein
MSGQIEAKSLGRDYRDGKHSLTVLDDVNLLIEPREFVAITGPSGSGKSTLLGLMAGLDRPTRGHVRIDATQITLWARTRCPRSGAGTSASSSSPFSSSRP